MTEGQKNALKKKIDELTDRSEDEIKAKIMVWLLNMKLTRFRLGSHWDYEFKYEDYYLLVRMTEKLPLTFNREEVYGMLKTVREEEKRMGWKCPEPEESIQDSESLRGKCTCDIGLLPCQIHEWNLEL